MKKLVGCKGLNIKQRPCPVFQGRCFSCQGYRLVSLYLADIGFSSSVFAWIGQSFEWLCNNS
ncbi:hypothetical protein [Flavobacterium beibuense]|uniref:Uncharacterized protein n=1 Tax=Flavobacterium beibuense TaxID=657326 RepID=A0A444WA60_9FLAO|nr:hypothetical protein [Flavobacterium beibuense]RYJ42777.1 hypothetical protein NU09_1876 [Flavobacterium beibuense]